MQTDVTPADGWWLSHPHRLSLWHRLWLWALPAIEALNRRCSAPGNAEFFDPARFPWVRELEHEWRAIRAELDAVLERRSDLPGFQDIVPEVGVISHDRGWKTFLLCGLGVVSNPNVARCPHTWRIVQRIPGVSMAMFSIFEPRKRLPPHRGPYNGVLRLHLGLIVPKAADAVAIRVGTTVRHWEEGVALVLDDSIEHEAWNETDEVRVVLFVDFERPLRFPANVVNRLVMRLARRSALASDFAANHRTWERAFYGASATPPSRARS